MTPSSSAADSSPPQHLPEIGIVCALHLEIAPFLDRCTLFRSESGNGFKFRGCAAQDKKICVVEGGTGRDRARQATHAIIDAYAPRWILSVGFSGALVEGINVGDIVVGDGLTDDSGRHPLAVDLRLEPAPDRGLHVGRLCTVDHIVRESREKKLLAERTGAIAVDMESLAVAEVCRERKTRFLAIRAVSDDAATDLPSEVLGILGPKGTIRAGAVVGSILKRPGSVKDLWNMREKANLAAKHLAMFLIGVVRQLEQ